MAKQIKVIKRACIEQKQAEALSYRHSQENALKRDSEQRRRISATVSNWVKEHQREKQTKMQNALQFAKDFFFNIPDASMR